jgi:hypothetical protein
MADNIIKLKKNNTPGAVPTISDLQYGELAINTADGILYVKRTGAGGDYIEKVTPESYSPYTWSDILSGITTTYGNNTILQPFATILGGYSNTNDGPGSTILNGQNNNVVGSYSLIGGGANNVIGIDGDSSAIIGGDNNFINHKNTFTLGSGLTSQADNFTYTNNISSTGIVYDQNGNSDQWNSSYTTVQSNSAEWASNDTALIELTGNWENTYNVVLANSANWDSVYNNVNSTSAENATRDYVYSNYLPLTGGTITGNITASNLQASTLQLDSVNITGNTTTATSMTADNIFIQITFNGVTKYIRLYDVE